MSVTEKIDYCSIRVLLKTCGKNRIVAEEELSLFVLDTKCIGNLNDVVPTCVPSNLRWSIVVTNYEMDMTIEFIKYFVDVIVISTEEEVSKNIDVIVLTDCFIPVTNESPRSFPEQS